jgi:hypothetical protein
MTRDERIVKDLATNLREKIARNISDFSSLCESAEVNPRLMVAEVMTLLLQVTTAYAVIQYNISSTEFTEAVGRYFEHAQKKHRENSE